MYYSSYLSTKNIPSTNNRTKHSLHFMLKSALRLVLFLLKKCHGIILFLRRRTFLLRPNETEAKQFVVRMET